MAAPAGFAARAMVAVGKQGGKQNLPRDLQKRETPTDRRKLPETVFEGRLRRRLKSEVKEY